MPKSNRAPIATRPRTKRQESLLILGDATVETATDVSTEVATDVSTTVATRVSSGVSAERVADHEARMHIPPPNRTRLQAIPYPNATSPDDTLLAWAVEQLNEGQTMWGLSSATGIRVPVLELALADYDARWQRFLMNRRSGL